MGKKTRGISKPCRNRGHKSCSYILFRLFPLIINTSQFKAFMVDTSSIRPRRLFDMHIFEPNCIWQYSMHCLQLCIVPVTWADEWTMRSVCGRVFATPLAAIHAFPTVGTGTRAIHGIASSAVFAIATFFAAFAEFAVGTLGLTLQYKIRSIELTDRNKSHPRD